MKYRINQRTGDRISEIGIGYSYMYEAGTEEAVRALRAAYEGGINYFDLAAGHGSSFPIYGEALNDVRDRIFYQIHFGADYTSESYGWTLDPDTIMRSVEKQLNELRTDYIDYGFVHCLDSIADWNKYKDHGVYDRILELKKAGVVHHIGLSSHTPAVIQKVLDEAEIDMLMFSVNAAYDYGRGTYGKHANERTAVYQRCAKEGIGISVMKPFSGGQLLTAEQSPFGRKMNIYQCMRYALDRPGVLTVLPGAQSTAQVKELLAYEEQPEEVTDYSLISSFAPPKEEGKCVYCNHCAPCPAGLDIALINKYYDLAKSGDGMALIHYRNLEKQASDCIQCGHCDHRCPFGVHQSARMQEIAAWMEKHA
ncbi:MAG: aldo/keto reductase [Solobacterium sp.]|nr:aldo/keto reductase [Solobacterium sp.]